ncbi:MAG: AMP-binding protein, partial [bacterium]|nr:AMP-binding protein [bacterium]
PTENTTFSTTYLIDGDFRENIPIGKPIANTTAYILDRVGRLQPVGATGELCLSGDGLSRGYLNNPELTAEKFYKSYKTNRSYIFYKTGDLARWLQDGNIEFLGRIDDQVKIRGFRIEPGEIQNRVLQYEGIKEALVTVHTGQQGEKSLCAYAVGDVKPNALKDFLAQSLPDYMIPNHFIKIEKFPLTVNGKINRSALPKPQYTDNSLTFNAPENKTQETLQETWSRVLGIPKNKISTTADFFGLGGHSLKAMLLVSDIRKTFNVDFPLSRVFSDPTIREQAGFIKKAHKANYRDIQPAEKRTHYPQSSAQKRLFFLDHFEDIGTSYNIPSRLDVTIPGTEKNEKIETIFKTLLRRPAALST